MPTDLNISAYTWRNHVNKAAFAAMASVMKKPAGKASTAPRAELKQLCTTLTLELVLSAIERKALTSFAFDI